MNQTNPLQGESQHNKLSFEAKSIWKSDKLKVKHIYSSFGDGMNYGASQMTSIKNI